jgi:hypothetical protein
MKVTILPDCYGWHAQVVLNAQEWPPLDYDDLWLDRPIRRWVTEECEHSTNFSYYGHIMFAHEDDLVKFLLTWS